MLYLRKDQMHGSGKYTHSDGSVYDGSWDEGTVCYVMLCSVAIDKTTCKVLFRYSFNYANFARPFFPIHPIQNMIPLHICPSQMHGKGVFRYANGNVYTGEFKRDNKEGYGVLTYQHGGRYEGYWTKDLADGRGQVTYEGGESYVGEFSKGMKHGQVQIG